MAVVMLVASFVVVYGQQSVLILRGEKIDQDGRLSIKLVRYKADAQSPSLLRAEDIAIRADGLPVKVETVDCPAPFSAVDLSSVLTIDVSGSMIRGGPNILLAKSAARAWVQALSPESECAITAFDHKAELVTDFTRDTETLLNAITSLHPRGGTDFDAGMLTPYIGGLPIASTGKNKRVLVFLTDGNGNGSAKRMIDEARANGITVYCVSLGMSMPNVLRQTSEQTGGLWFENVTTVQQAEMAYRRIYADAVAPQMCTIEVVLPPSCSRSRLLSIRVGSDSIQRVIETPGYVQILPHTTPRTLHFDSLGTPLRFTVKAGKMQLTLTGVSTPTITQVSLTLNGKKPEFPISILADDSLTFELTTSYRDSSYAVGRVQFVSVPCPLPAIYFTAGSVRYSPAVKTIHVVSPNGRERIPAVSRAVLKYDGVAPDQPIRVEVSTDLGNTWTLVHEKATDFEVPWRAPLVSSDSCLLRVSQVVPDETRLQPRLIVSGIRIEQAEYSADGSLLVTAGLIHGSPSKGVDTAVRIHSTGTGAILASFPGVRFAFANGGKSLCTWELSGTIDCYDIASRSLQWRHEIALSKQLITVLPDRAGSTALIIGGWVDLPRTISCETGLTIAQLPKDSKAVQSGSISSDGTMVALCGRDSSVTIYDSRSGAVRHKLVSNSPTQFYAAAFSPNGSRIVATTGMGQAQVWNTTDGALLRTIAKRQYINDNAYVTFMPDGSRVILETGKDETSIIDVETGETLVTMQRSAGYGGVVSAVASFDGALVALSSLGRLTIHETSSGVMIYEMRQVDYHPSFSPDAKRMFVRTSEPDAGIYDIIPAILQSDTSDYRWSVYRTNARLRDVRFGSRISGQAVDSLVRAGLYNNSDDTISLDSIWIEGADTKHFAVRTTSGAIIRPKDSLDIEYSFTPTKAGERAAAIVARVSGSILRSRISGPCMESLISADADFVDLGVLDVGEYRDLVADELLTNTGKTPVSILSIRNTGTDSSSFSVISPTTFTISPDASAEVIIRFTATRQGRLSTRLAIDVKGYSEPLYATLYGIGTIDTFRVAISDPTTFRSILLPSAIVPRQGTITTSMYDVIGIVGGYSITDNVMVIVGGVPPFSNRWVGASDADASTTAAWSVGAKIGFPVTQDLTIGGGYQTGQSYYNRTSTEDLDSKITFNALWASAGWGNDDSRLNVLIGYTFKRHNTASDGSFNADATIIGVAYDQRISYHWKICGEMVFMRTMTFLPITCTARYFDDVQAFDIGFTVTGIATSGANAISWPIVPLLTWVRRW